MAFPWLVPYHRNQGQLSSLYPRTSSPVLLLPPPRTVLRRNHTPHLTGTLEDPVLVRVQRTRHTHKSEGWLTFTDKWDRREPGKPKRTV